MTMIVLVGAGVWLGALVALVALSRAAALGDRADWERRYGL
jgi:putative copper export protein